MPGSVGGLSIERYEMRAKFWLGNLNGRDHLEDLDVVGKIMLE
jgi:hypothetical protein